MELLAPQHPDLSVWRSCRFKQPISNAFRTRQNSVGKFQPNNRDLTGAIEAVTVQSSRACMARHATR